MDFLKKKNHDDVFWRGLLVGLISILNEKVTYLQSARDSDYKMEEVFIPFLPSLVGDEPFLMDHFLDYGDCNGAAAFAEGNYDVVPRGIIEDAGCTIVSSSFTNKFVRGTYMKEIPNDAGGAEMKAYSSYLNPIPLSQTYNIRIKLDTELELFKVRAKVLEIFHRNFVYYFEYNGIRIPAQGSFSDSVGEHERVFRYSYGEGRKDVTLSFSITVETYLPQLDLTTEKFRGNLMQAGIKLRTSVGNTTTSSDNKQFIKGIDATENEVNVRPATGSDNQITT